MLPTVSCPYCNAENPVQALFCQRCGQTLHMSESVETERSPSHSPLNQRYRIVQLLGKGGMGAVYKGEDLKFHGRAVAIKEMLQGHSDPLEAKMAISMFEQEARLLASLKHPNLPSIYDYFTENGRWYLVMDFIEGTTLSERLKKARGQALPVRDALDIGIQLAKVLGYLHSRPSPIIFRDLKPLNIMITPDENVYLIDFGIARLFKPGKTQDTVAYVSAGYAAPEQYGNAQTQTSPQSDIYSLGATLHQLLSGQNPADSPFSFKPLHVYNSQLPPALTGLVAQMINMDPAQRPASMAIVRQVLEQVQMQIRQGVLPPATLPASGKSGLLTQLPAFSAPASVPAPYAPVSAPPTPVRSEALPTQYSQPLYGQQGAPQTSPPAAYGRQPGYAAVPTYADSQPAMPLSPFPTGQVQQSRPGRLQTGKAVKAASPQQTELSPQAPGKAVGMGVLTAGVITGAAYLIPSLDTGTNAVLFLVGCLVLSGIITGRLTLARNMGFLAGAITGAVFDAVPAFVHYYTVPAYHAAHLNFYATPQFYLTLLLAMVMTGLVSLFGAWLATLTHPRYRKTKR